MAKSRIYNIWVGMKQRCRNTKSTSYYKYGGRGIDYIDDWQSFDCFYDDMYTSYKEHVKKHGERNTSLDRIDNMSGYKKENCRWATPKEQARNIRKNSFLTYDGQTFCISEWAEKLGIAKETLIARKKYGWKTEDILFKPVKHKNYVVNS